jgi:hypothetical protein
MLGRTFATIVRTALLLATVFPELTGCSSGQSGGLRPGESASCTVTLSGAQTGQFDCRPATTTISAGQGSFQFGVSASNDGGSADGAEPLGVSAIIYFSGGPTPASYSSSGSSGGLGGVTISGVGAWTSGLSGGAYDLTFTSFAHPVTSGTATLYQAEGSLDATLVPVANTGATGTITLRATF